MNQTPRFSVTIAMGLILALGGALGAALPVFAQSGSDYTLIPAFPGLTFDSPVGLLQAPGDDSRFYVVGQGGVITTFDPAVPGTRVWADLTDRAGFGGERGLFALAFHPAWPTNPSAFVSYTDKTGASVLSRMTASADLSGLDTSTEQVILRVDQPFGNHNGGQIAFGPDGFLYLGLGDGGSGGDPLDHGQNPATLLGAILRLDVDSGDPYAIPADNPFAANPDCANGCPEIYAWGFRNPWRFSFDPATGDLWAADVGQSRWEEVALVKNGENHGWNCFEGRERFGGQDCLDLTRFTFPVHAYEHGSGRCSVTGGYVYRGNLLADLVGIYLFADYCTGEVWGLTPIDGGFRAEEIADADFRIASFGQGNNGEVYILDYDSGAVYGLARSAAP